MAFFVPTGLGIGTNVETHPDQLASHAQAMQTLGARWSYSWGRLPVGPNYMPSLFPEARGVMTATELCAWRNAMISAGQQWDQLTWTFCNEPEASGKTPLDLTRLITAQLAQFALANIRLRIVFPNNNINTQASFDYGVEAFQRVRQAGVLVSPGVHLWCEAQYVPAVWDRYRAWIEGYGDRLAPITITECGPGPMCSMEQWLEFMPLAYRLLDDPRVGALAPFAAYPKTLGDVERHPGFMLRDGTLTPLGVQYRAEMARRSEPN